jgi:parallel beta-helix repeat protein
MVNLKKKLFNYMTLKHHASKLTMILLFTNCISVLATNYFVSPTGNNNNNGQSVNLAFQTLNFAANVTAPGDTVFVMNGTYINVAPASNILDIYNSGTANQPITYINFPGHSPLLKLNGNNWSGIALQGADYITIDGFKIVGNNDSITLVYAQLEQLNTNNPATSGNGIGITAEYNNISNKPHHNIIRNCNISKCGGAGIYGYRADYTTIQNNTVFECAWYAPYGNSGISLYQCYNSDSLNNIRNYILNNTCYRNENYVPFIAVGNITDGNGIIIDDGRNTQNGSTQGVYLGKTYIANNLMYDNGGRGIHVYESDKVIIVNNTCYQNCQSPAIQDGEFTAYEADSVFFINNIAFPSANIPPIDKSVSTTNLFVNYNLWATNSNIANPYGTNTIIGNPNFIFPSNDPLLADFHLSSNSNAINAGTYFYAPNTDKDGLIRSLLDSVDVGCYEFQLSTLVKNTSNEDDFYYLYPNPTNNILNLIANSSVLEPFEVSFYSLNGQLFKLNTKDETKHHKQFDISYLNNGIYLVKIIDSTNNVSFKKFVKIQ